MFISKDATRLLKSINLLHDKLIWFKWNLKKFVSSKDTLKVQTRRSIDARNTINFELHIQKGNHFSKQIQLNTSSFV